MVRLATMDDLEAALNLYKELRTFNPSLGSSFARTKWAELIGDTQTYIVVAELDGELASTCALGINNSIANGARPFAIIEHVITSSKLRRQGLSRQVLEFSISLAWQKDCYKVMLLSDEELRTAHALYESVGFKGGVEKGFVIKSPV